MSKKTNVIFLCNRLTTDLKLPVVINSDYDFDKARKAEIEIIKDTLSNKIESNLAIGRSNPFEMISFNEISKRKTKKTFHKLGDKAKPNKWHYWVIRHNGIVGMNHSSEMLFPLIESELIPIAHYRIQKYKTKDGRFKHHAHTRTTYGHAGNQIHDLGNTMKESQINESDIKELKKLFAAFRKIEKRKEDYEFIFRNLKNYKTLLRMPIYDDLRNIGKFAIIESLLTTRKSVQIESINHQLKNKIVLLNNRFSKEIQFQKWFKSLPENFNIRKLIGLLYSYRSCLAHGTKPDFDKELKIIENSVWTDYCVDEICRKVLKQAIFEPELIKDLRHC